MPLNASMYAARVVTEPLVTLLETMRRGGECRILLICQQLYRICPDGCRACAARYVVRQQGCTRIQYVRVEWHMVFFTFAFTESVHRTCCDYPGTRIIPGYRVHAKRKVYPYCLNYMKGIVRFVLPAQ